MVVGADDRAFWAWSLFSSSLGSVGPAGADDATAGDCVLAAFVLPGGTGMGRSGRDPRPLSGFTSVIRPKASWAEGSQVRAHGNPQHCEDAGASEPSAAASAEPD